MTHRYGVEIINDIPFLFQRDQYNGDDCLDQNLRSSEKLELSPELKRLPPPHQFDFSEWAAEQLPDEMINNPLVDLYLPKPVLEKPTVAFIRHKGMEPFPVLKKLADLSCLHPNAVRIYQKRDIEKAQAELQLTNLGPLTLVGVMLPESMPIYNLTEFATVNHRHLIITGHPDIPMPKDAQNFTSAYQVVEMWFEQIRHLDFKKIGATYLRNWARYYYNQLNSG